MRRMFAGLALLLAVGAGQARAGVLTFDDIPGSGNNNALFVPAGYGGLDWTLGLLVVDITNPGSPWGGAGPAFSGQNVLTNNWGGPATISVSSGTFTFSEVETQNWYSDVPRAGQINGYLNGSLQFTIDYTANGDWTHVSGNSIAIDTLVINGGNYFLLDDLNVNVATGSAVPEPASMRLLALGAVGMAGYRLRRRFAKAESVAAA
ncbi:PEP-CTERM sorting domain-containing protein [bacterium]|nr:PEP-CTERM sorting domain-containing protein [bacterium]